MRCMHALLRAIDTTHYRCRMRNKAKFRSIERFGLQRRRRASDPTLRSRLSLPHDGANQAKPPAETKSAPPPPTEPLTAGGDRVEGAGARTCASRPSAPGRVPETHDGASRACAPPGPSAPPMLAGEYSRVRNARRDDDAAARARVGCSGSVTLGYGFTCRRHG